MMLWEKRRKKKTFLEVSNGVIQHHYSDERLDSRCHLIRSGFFSLFICLLVRNLFLVVKQQQQQWRLQQKSFPCQFPLHSDSWIVLLFINRFASNKIIVFSLIFQFFFSFSLRSKSCREHTYYAICIHSIEWTNIERFSNLFFHFRFHSFYSWTHRIIAS